MYKTEYISLLCTRDIETGICIIFAKSYACQFCFSVGLFCAPGLYTYYRSASDLNATLFSRTLECLSTFVPLPIS
ncbi:hypothetical protein FKM82_026085 [Ascaphus truei]